MSFSPLIFLLQNHSKKTIITWIQKLLIVNFCGMSTLKVFHLNKHTSICVCILCLLGVSKVHHGETVGRVKHMPVVFLKSWGQRPYKRCNFTTVLCSVSVIVSCLKLKFKFFYIPKD